MRTQQQKLFIYRFYIGSNNITKKREIQKTLNLLDKNKVMGYTLLKSVGFWNTDKENSFIIEIIKSNDNPINDNKVLFLKKELEQELKQYLVLTTKQKLNILN